MGWTFPRLCKMRGHAYGHSTVWIYSMKNLDPGDVKFQGKKYFYILTVCVQGNGVTSMI